MGRLSSAGPLGFAGGILALLGMAALAVPYFTTMQTRDVARIGDLKLQTTESTSYAIPPLLGGGLLMSGLVLIGAGLLWKN